MAQDIKQHGTQLETDGAPKLADYIVVKGTWEEVPKKYKTQLETDNGDGETENICGSNPVRTAKCDLVIKATKTAPNELDIISEASPSTLKWLVRTVTEKKAGGVPNVCSVELEYYAVRDGAPVIPSQS